MVLCGCLNQKSDSTRARVFLDIDDGFLRVPASEQSLFFVCLFAAEELSNPSLCFAKP